MIGASPSLIYPGQELLLPGGSAEPDEPVEEPAAMALEAFTTQVANT